MEQRDLLDAKLLVAQRLLERGKFSGQGSVGFVLFHGDGCADLIANHVGSQFDSAQLVGVHGDAHFAVARGLDQLRAVDEMVRGGVGERQRR